MSLSLRGSKGVRGSSRASTYTSGISGSARMGGAGESDQQRPVQAAVTGPRGDAKSVPVTMLGPVSLVAGTE